MVVSSYTMNASLTDSTVTSVYVWQLYCKNQRLQVEHTGSVIGVIKTWWTQALRWSQ